MKQKKDLYDIASAETFAENKKENMRVRSIMTVVMAGLCVLLTGVSLVPLIYDIFMSLVGFVELAAPAVIAIACMVLGVILLVALLLTALIAEVFPPAFVPTAILAVLYILVVSVGYITASLAPTLLITVVISSFPTKIAVELIGIALTVLALIFAVITFIIARIGRKRAETATVPDRIDPDAVMYRIAKIISRVCVIVLATVLAIFAVLILITLILVVLVAALVVIFIVPGFMLGLI